MKTDWIDLLVKFAAIAVILTFCGMLARVAIK